MRVKRCNRQFCMITKLMDEMGWWIDWCGALQPCDSHVVTH